MTNFSTYSVTEEAFLHSSLHELVKVWASGSGKASFHLDICDGVAELQLNFKLGHPSQSHCDQYVPQHHHLHDQQEGYQPRRRRRKGPARRERDRLRAAEHHARTTQTPQDVFLPFNGRILATKPRISSSNHKSQFDDITAAPAVKATAATAVTPSTFRPPLPVVQPGKPCSTSRHVNIEVNTAKKKLFVLPLPRGTSPKSAHSGKKTYKMKEDDLWTKLFEL